MGLAQRLRGARVRAKLTQQALADRVGVSDAYIAQLETGAKSNPSLVVLRGLAAALEIPLTTLLDDKPRGQRSKTGQRARTRGPKGK
jgi:transcriptional regulator with XRE-family HTH domain